MSKTFHLATCASLELKDAILTELKLSVTSSVFDHVHIQTNSITNAEREKLNVQYRMNLKIYKNNDVCVRV